MRGLAAALCLYATPALAESHGGHAHWGYEGEGGPAHWGDLQKDFEACKLGKAQTPIDIKAAKKADLPAIAFSYKPTPLVVVDNGHTIQVKVAPGSTITVGDKTFELVQFHFHRPSEEKLKGKASAMDAHLVHKDSAGNLAVVAVLFENGKENPVLGAALKNLPDGEGERAVEGVTVDPTQLLPEKRAYYTFSGSLTTPPCSEGVTWFVLKSPAKVSPKEVSAFAKRYPNNARPVQALGDRVVEESR
jgi:carbonic anhydrase